MTTGSDADLAIIGAGPAGCSTALMASSLGMRSILVEAERVGKKLRTITAIDNVAGDWATGTALAQALERDIVRLSRSGRCLLLRGRAVRVQGGDDRARVVLADGSVVDAAAVVVATGVSTISPVDADWVTVTDDVELQPLWCVQSDDRELRGCVYVLGGDRPLGTWLRSQPGGSHPLNVLYPPADAYKVAEITVDNRATLRQVDHVTISRYGRERYLVKTTASGVEEEHVVDTILSNLGSKPAPLKGLVQAAGGYCPPETQHPRVLTVGDVRSPQFQRIATAQGSGAEAALSHYYATCRVDTTAT